MNLRIQLSCILGTLLLLAVPCSAQKKVGTTAAPFLGIGVGPRAMGMGGAFVAEGNDVSALYWNPGAFSRPGRSQVMASHTGWLVGTDFNWIGLQIALDEDNSFGISLTQLDYGEDIVTTVTNPEGTGERWTASDMAFSVSFARNLSDRFSIGGSFKYITQRIWNETASAFAFDVGLLFITPFDNMRLGMSFTNFGTAMQMEGKDLVQRIDLDPEVNGNNKTIVAALKTDSWELPLYFRAGVAYDLVKNGMMTFTVAADAVRPNDNDEYINVGGEISYKDIVYLRAGYRTLFLTSSEEGFTAGAGFNYTIIGSTAASIDYTYQAFGIFEGINTITLGITF